MKMRKLLSLVLAVATAFMVTACSENTTSVTSGTSINEGGAESINNSESISENSSNTNENITVQNSPNKVDDTLPQCEPANLNYKNVMKGDSGYYYKDSWQVDEDTFSSGIVYYDNATGKTLPLCSKPQCMHDGNAFCASSSFDSEYDVLYNGYIYRLGYHITETEYAIRLLRSDLQGNELSKVTDVHKDLLSGSGQYPMIESLVFHYGKIILAFEKISGDQSSRVLYMVDLETGIGKEIYVPEPENNATRIFYQCYRTLVADGDWLYYTTKEAKWSHLQAHDDAHRIYDRTTMYRFNIKTGATEIISAMPDIYSSFTVNDGIIYYTVADRKENTFSLYSYDIAKDRTETFVDKHQQNYVDGKYVSDRNKVTVLTDRKYLYICTRGISGSSHLKENVDDIDFYIYDLEGNQLLHGLPGMDVLRDMKEEWSYTFSAIDGEIYFYYQNDKDRGFDVGDNAVSGMYRIKTEDLINGKTDWKKLYKSVY